MIATVSHDLCVRVPAGVTPAHLYALVMQPEVVAQVTGLLDHGVSLDGRCVPDTEATWYEAAAALLTRLQAGMGPVC